MIMMSLSGIAQSTFSLSAEGGFSYNRGRGYNLGMGGEFRLTERSSITTYLRISTVYVIKGGQFYDDNGSPMNSDFASSLDYFQGEYGSDFGGLVSPRMFWEDYDFYLKQYEPKKKDFRHDYVLSVLYNYDLIHTSRWEASFGIGLGLGIADDMDMISGYNIVSNTGEVLLLQISRRVKYLYYHIPVRLEVNYEIAPNIELLLYGSIHFMPQGNNFNPDLINRFVGIGTRFSMGAN